MAKKRRAHDEEAWRNAKKICRLNVRQLEMARRLGMNPKKLPRLRPDPRERWKLPVGEFIEDLYAKRFGVEPVDRHRQGAELLAHKPVRPRRHADAPEDAVDAAGQVADLVFYLKKLADHLEGRLAYGTIEPQRLSQVREELREIVAALDAGAPISPMPAIPSPPDPARRTSLPQSDEARTFADDEIPF